MCLLVSDRTQRNVAERGFLGWTVVIIKGGIINMINTGIITTPCYTLMKGR